MATTTYQAIRDNYITAIEALTPATTPDRRFRRGNKRTTVEDRAQNQNATAGLMRAFEIRRTSAGEEVAYFHPTEFEVREEFDVAIAYPTLTKLYGSNGFDDMEKVIEQDANQVRDALSSTGNLSSGQNTCMVTSIALEPTEDFWVLVITAEIHYYKSQTLT